MTGYPDIPLDDYIALLPDPSRRVAEGWVWLRETICGSNHIVCVCVCVCVFVRKILGKLRTLVAPTSY